MKKKILVSIVLCVSLFVAIYSFTTQSKAVNLNDPDLELTVSEQNDLLAAFDLDHNGKLQSRDVTLMLKNNYNKEEVNMVQRCIVYDMRFIWSYRQVYSLNSLFESMKNNEVLYTENLTKEGKLVVHLKAKDRKYCDFIVVTYNYGNGGLHL